MGRTNPTFAALAALCLSACGSDLGSATSANREGTNDQGTRLRVTAAADPCEDGQATVALSGDLVSTAAGDATIITASVDGGEEVAVGTILPTDFSRDGAEKTAHFEVTVGVPAGSHTVVLCFTQHGADGRYPKRVCFDVAVTACEEPESAPSTEPPAPEPPAPPAPEPPPPPGGDTEDPNCPSTCTVEQCDSDPACSICRICVD